MINKFLITFVMCLFIAFAELLANNARSENQMDSIIENSFKLRPAAEKVSHSEVKSESKDNHTKDITVNKYIPLDLEQILNQYEASKIEFETPVNNLYLNANPFFRELTFSGYCLKTTDLIDYPSVDEILRMNKFKESGMFVMDFPGFMIAENYIANLRNEILREFVAFKPEKFKFKTELLPDVKDLVEFKIETRPVDQTLEILENKVNAPVKKIVIDKPVVSPWVLRSNAMLQFSQSYISSNWHKGGSDNMSVLGIINGQFNYDNKKNVQWENFAEWRLGVNTAEGEKIRMFNTNDDIIRYNSKLGIKAGGSWFYSGTFDFSTQFFSSYKSQNSSDKVAAFLTPVRMNVGVGFDYKYKKLISLMISPVSYKFIYANDTIGINKKSFGILPGDKVLSQLGSSFRAQFSYAPSKEIQIDSKLTFYTNYQKIEVDWEIVSNFVVNRYLSTRLSLNPRYDNTMILNKGEKAKIQFKELLTFGFSYRLR